MNKILFVNKEKGMTSFDICFKLRKVFMTKSIGHTGTLDPNAEGVMIILIDKATKLNQFLVHDTKEYIGEVEIGIKTDTLDIDGKIIEEKEEVMPSEQKIDAALRKFLGKSLQIPPMTSSIKVNGKKLYEYQREGKEVVLEPRPIEIFEIELLSITDDKFTFRCKCSSGTYIRKLAEDVLLDLGLIGTLTNLKRTKVGDVDISECYTLEDIYNNKYELVEPMQLLTQIYENIEVENDLDIKNGKRIELDTTSNEVLLSKHGHELAIYERVDGKIFKSKRGLF